MSHFNSLARNTRMLLQTIVLNRSYQHLSKQNVAKCQQNVAQDIEQDVEQDHQRNDEHDRQQRCRVKCRAISSAR